MDTRYTCKICDHSYVIKAGQLTTADVKTHCDMIMNVTYEPTTPEEAEQLRIAAEALRNIAQGKCPVCGITPTNRIQVGKDVYLAPCGHRYQGQLKKES